VTEFKQRDRTALREHAAELRARYDAIAARRLSLDMTRGKPCPDQVIDDLVGLGRLRRRTPHPHCATAHHECDCSRKHASPFPMTHTPENL